MRTTNRTIAAFALLIATASQAQDQQFTQFDAAPMLLNPALTGMPGADDWGFRGVLQHRDQWRGIGTKPFRNTAASFEVARDRMGFGGVMRMERAGAGGQGSFTFLLSGAYDIMNNAEGKHMLTVGVQAGIVQRTFDPGALTFDQQYVNGGFNTGLPSGEELQRTSLLGVDANMGVAYAMLDEEQRVRPFGGAMLAHVTSPRQSYFDAEDRTPTRLVVHGGAEYDLDARWTLRPLVQYQAQARVQQLTMAMQAVLALPDGEHDLVAGLGYRTQDALMVMFGVRFRETILRLSYDHTMSHLRRYNGGMGAFELAVVHTGAFTTKKRSN